MAYSGDSVPFTLQALQALLTKYIRHKAHAFLAYYAASAQIYSNSAGKLSPVLKRKEGGIYFLRKRQVLPAVYSKNATFFVNGGAKII
jgi:CMP-N-acetylneuraminic acid synthetase